MIFEMFASLLLHIDDTVLEGNFLNELKLAIRAKLWKFMPNGLA